MTDEVYSALDRERLVGEAAKSQERTPFERDRARIVHSSALRRLGAKTQVLGPSSHDFVRTRLTHSLEVAQVGRELGKALGCDPDVVDSACLAHDLGHPPFGHNGERALAQAATGIGGFEGNAQTLRLLTRLEPKVSTPQGRSVGLNLTRASLDAAIKYPWRLSEAPHGARVGRPSPKFGVYDDDLDVFAWVRQDAPGQHRCLEAQVMDLADDISYSVHDVEDAVVAGRVDPVALHSREAQDRIVQAVRTWYGDQISVEELYAALDRLVSAGFWPEGFDGSRRSLSMLKNATSQLIGRFVKAAHSATRGVYGPGPHSRYGADLIVPDATTAEILVLKGTAVTYVMAPREALPIHTTQREVLLELVEILVERGRTGLEGPFAADWDAAADDDAKLRVVIDQVASLTDVSALSWYEDLTGKRV